MNLNIEQTYKILNSIHDNNSVNCLIKSWASHCRINYLDLLLHFNKLCSEYYEVYNREHECSKDSLNFLKNAHKLPSAFGTLFPFEAVEVYNV